uniref:Protein kinase domain-containing protein n=1 Tax=Oryza punctata TaxID=4537 RepID=A0A0E0M0M0_ORYPU
MGRKKVVIVVFPAGARVLAIVALLVCCCKAAAVQGGDGTTSVRESLVGFLTELAGGDEERARGLGWDASVEPCNGNRTVWPGIGCNGAGDGRITSIVLERKGLDGTINATTLCAAARALRVLSLQGNALRGDLPAAISGCSRLTHIYVGANRLSGSLPPSLVHLTNLQVLNVSRNNFSGEIPAGLSKLVGLVRFCGNDNRFNGTIPEFELSRFDDFSVANNNLTGPIPEYSGDFGGDSFSGNSDGLCGRPNFPPCPPSSNDNDEKKRRRVRTIVMCLGYILLGAGVAAFVLYMLCSKRRRRPSGVGVGKSAFDSSSKAATTTDTPSATPGKSAYSLAMSEERTNAAAAVARAPPPASLVVLQRSGTTSTITLNTSAVEAARKLRFEDLLKSPAELLGRGRFGSAYKVVVPGGAALAVKRVKDAAAEEEFRRRMERVGKVRHPAVLPPLAFYCAMQEKLVVYEFLSQGSLAKLLHGSIESSQVALDWPARLHIAAKVADAMAFMHDALRGDGDGEDANLSFSSYSDEAEASAFGGDAIAHGNLKASNILFTATMEPCISEYGVTAPPLPPSSAPSATLRADVRSYGVLLLELLTGKATAADGAELARWVTAVIREEWTAEVFDRAMLSAVASEQGMVRLLQVAMRCIDATSPPPTMREVAGMVNAIREEDDMSLSSEA